MDGNGFQEPQVSATHFKNEIINMQVWVFIPTCITDGYASYVLQYCKKKHCVTERKVNLLISTMPIFSLGITLLHS